MKERKNHGSIWVNPSFDDGKYHIEVIGETNFSIVHLDAPTKHYRLGQLIINKYDGYDRIKVGTKGYIVAIRDPDLIENRYSEGNDNTPNGHYVLDIMFESFPLYLPTNYEAGKEVWTGGFRRRTLDQVEPA